MRGLPSRVAEWTVALELSSPTQIGHGNLTSLFEQRSFLWLLYKHLHAHRHSSGTIAFTGSVLAQWPETHQNVLEAKKRIYGFPV